MSQFQFKINDNNQVVATTEIDSNCTAIKESVIKEHFTKSEHCDCYMLDDLVAEYAALYNQKLIPPPSEPIQFEAPIAEKRDAKVNVVVSADAMSAKIEITGPYGGKALTSNQVMRIITKNGVTMGVNKAEVEKISLAAEQSKPGQLLSADIAKGQQPVKGDDSWFEPLTKNARDRILQPQEVNETGKVDMRDLGELISVKPGDALVRRHLPTHGKPGFTVKGDALSAVPGQLIDFDIGDGTQLASHDENLLVAQAAGLPYVTAKGARVDDVLELKGVDVSTGHIDFDGGVIVNGDVAEGMRLKAKGNVTINGFVENALIEVDGDVTVLNGIIGRKVDTEHVDDNTEFACVIKATGVVCSKYIQYAKVISSKEVFFSSQLSNVYVKARAVVGGTEQTPLGKIISGYFDVQDFLSCASIGAPASTALHVHLYSNFQSDVTKKQAVFSRLKVKAHELELLRANWLKLKEQGIGEDKNAQIAAKYKERELKVKKLKKAYLLLEKKIQQQFKQVYVYASRTMFSHIHIHCGELNKLTTGEHTNSRIKVVERKFVRV
ncbi:hypothetical protein DS2_00360 [Catenovulum agarivorans DS-2]|uniref:Flagellar Assembly Protein A N-terminal region domain-containing protein n=1 Tax=Catenovulum agarivorans DS-2 TaxID=1328313 RepID=W7QGQ9_9ALTE|nr:FapA family protein [Catenovulum agarivorans]EWH12129.1 hypothetical protein DS2_00360 [Catenovulum agarivorans DS-2]